MASALIRGPSSLGYWRIPRRAGMAAPQSARPIIETAEGPAPIGPYSQAVVANGVLYCSGQVPLDPASGELIEGGIAEQAARCLQSLDEVCRAAGTRLASAARIGIYLTDMDEFPTVNDVYAT